MSKNIIVCCDGTGNEISENISNVLKLYRTLRKTEKTEPLQTVFYDPGVGTLARPDPWTKMKQDTVAILGLAAGYGLDDNVLAAYRFLIEEYQDGDEIFLFGFSRGAYTVRVLAALVHKVGLLAPQQRNLADAALTAYKQTPPTVGDETAKLLHQSPDEEQADVPLVPNDRAAQFARIVSTRWPTIKFMGVWDTVASVIVPRPDRFYVFSLEELAFTRANPSVQVFRQAISIDECRRMFRLHPWSEPQIFMRNRFSKTNNSEPQDIRQVWFAGVHSGIGGGYSEKESAISKYPLIWMIEEAITHGLAVDRRTVNHLAWGKPRRGSPFAYVKPGFDGNPHDSMSPLWRLVEWFPKKDRYKEWTERPSLLGRYLPNAEPRVIPAGSVIHESVVARMRAIPDYRPVNLPESYSVAPLNEIPS